MPRLPPPPRFPPDARQAGAERILGSIARLAATTMGVAGPRFTHGFPASAVDLGRLQTALERGLKRFDAAQVEARWQEIFRWIVLVIGAWVQRYKELKIERHEQGIRVEMKTQDDLGYYDYAFDVFPRRGRGSG
jgi:hypothetical protein